MLRYSLFFLLLLSALYSETNQSQWLVKELKRLEIVFRNAMRDFRYGSYYEALDEFGYLAKFPDNPFYLRSLYMLANTYLHIGKRTGKKRYFWSAINYLNLYLSQGGKKDADYYYLKASIYENLGFYEKALANYKIALNMAKSKPKQLQIIIGLFRTSVMFERLDLATRYMLILSLESLQEDQKKEFAFLQGFYYFIKKEYKKAITFFKKSYKEYESYLIDNPEFYYLVAETAYRVGEKRFSERLLRRILNYVKNEDVLQKALLRLGDIKFLQKDYKSSASYYLRLVQNYPKSQNAIVAKLKLLYILKNDPKIAHYLKKFLPDALFLKEPQNFVIQNMVKYRTSYVGVFALANFGLEAFELDSPKLYKRLAWELSLLAVPRLTYEQKEYIVRLWRPYILNPKYAKAICKLYGANKRLFLELFDKKTLLKVASYLKGCKKHKEYIALLEELIKRYPQKDVKLLLAKALYEGERYKEAREVLESIKTKDCAYYKFYAKVCFVAQMECNGIYRELVKSCPKKELYTHIFSVYLNLDKKIDTSFLVRYKEELAKRYRDDKVVKRFVQIFTKKLIDKERYRDVINLLSPIANEIGSDCFLNSVLALSYVRIGKIDLAAELLERSKSCNNSWYTLAKLALEDAKLQKEIEGL